MENNNKICLITRDIIGPVKNGGIGTAFYHLANLLADNGYNVTILYTLDGYSESGDLEHWVEDYRKKGITFIPIPEFKNLITVSNDCVRESYYIYHWLKDQDFDLVHFHEWQGIGYYSLLAKYEGLYFQNTVMCIQTHSPVLWHMRNNADAVTSVDIVEADFMEQRCLELADQVISPSQYLLDWCMENHWPKPQKTEVIQNLLPREVYESEGGGRDKGVGIRYSVETSKPLTPNPYPLSSSNINEIVFFGRLEWRKGLHIFCDAIKKLPPETLKKLNITFLGKEALIEDIPAGEFITKKLDGVCDWKVIDNLDSHGAVTYLQGEGRLAVIASITENSPFTVLECIAHNVPFIAADTGGISELIAERNRSDTLFKLRAGTLSAKIEEVAENGISTVVPAVAFGDTKVRWLKLHEELLANIGAKTTPPQDTDKQEEKPLVSICLVHFNRPEYLKSAIESIRNQEYPNIEVILVDDGSSNPDAIECLNSLEEEFKERNWKIIRKENNYLGAARNTAAENANGEYLKFMDDDNYANPDEISTFVKVAQKTGADVLTSVMEFFSGDEIPREKPEITVLYTPLGGSQSMGVCDNFFGDANALVRKKAFMDVGGFTEDYGIGYEDFEFFAKIVIKGYKLEVIPKPLFLYRQSDSGMLNSTGRIQNCMRSIRPYLDNYPEISAALLMTQGFYIENKNIKDNFETSYEDLKNVFNQQIQENKNLEADNIALHSVRKNLEENNIALDSMRKNLEVDNLALHEGNQKLVLENKGLYDQIQSLDNKILILQEDSDKLNAIVKGAGEEIITLIPRLAGRKSTRIIMQCKVKALTKIMNTFSRVKQNLKSRN